MDDNRIAGLDINRLKPIAIERFGDDSKESLNQVALMIRVAHCARVSYLNFEGNDDYEADVKLYDRLSSMGHWSPFEHCAKALPASEPSGNFKGWLQLRKTFWEENKKDNRVEKKW